MALGDFDLRCKSLCSCTFIVKLVCIWLILFVQSYDDVLRFYELKKSR